VLYRDACRYTTIPPTSLSLSLFLFPPPPPTPVCSPAAAAAAAARRPPRKSTPLHPAFDLSFSSFRLGAGDVAEGSTPAGRDNNRAPRIVRLRLPLQNGSKRRIIRRWRVAFNVDRREAAITSAIRRTRRYLRDGTTGEKKYRASQPVARTVLSRGRCNAAVKLSGFYAKRFGNTFKHDLCRYCRHRSAVQSKAGNCIYTIIEIALLLYIHAHNNNH